jgi:putative membrane protein
MTRRASIGIAGLALLVATWAGPLPRMAAGSFTSHMLMHVLVVAVAMPLIAASLAKPTPSRPLPFVFPLIASIVDFVVIWVWHMPLLHFAASAYSSVMALQQASFAVVALFIWLVAFAGSPLAGALELFFTSMHMVLLGALLTLSQHPLYNLLCLGGFGLDPLTDQQLGGALMLTIGGMVYLFGGLFFVQRVLRARPVT